MHQIKHAIGQKKKWHIVNECKLATDLPFVWVTAAASTMENVPQANTEGNSQLLEALMETSLMEQPYVPEAVMQTAVMASQHLEDDLSHTGRMDHLQLQDLVINSGVVEPDPPQDAVSQTFLMDQCHLQDGVSQTGVMGSGPMQDHLELHHQDMNPMLAFPGYDMLDLSTLMNESLDSWPDAFMSNGAQDNLEDLETLLFSHEC